MVSANGIVARACRIARVDRARPELLRFGQNAIFRIRPGLIARVTREGGEPVAHKELAVSRWLAEAGVPVVRARDDVPQPIIIDTHAVTFWQELAIERPATTADVATLIAQVHQLAPPAELDLPDLAPFANIRQRITAPIWNEGERDALDRHLDALVGRYRAMPASRPWCGVHGDAWSGNVLHTKDGPVLIDLERFSWGPPEWDLVSTAVKYTTFGAISAQEWSTYCDIYGADVTEWSGFSIMRDIRELRETTFAGQAANHYPTAAQQARYRFECLQGQHGNRPWGWQGFTHTNGSHHGAAAQRT